MYPPSDDFFGAPKLNTRFDEFFEPLDFKISAVVLDPASTVDPL
jgi:hypothetical protein